MESTRLTCSKPWIFGKVRGVVSCFLVAANISKIKHCLDFRMLHCVIYSNGSLHNSVMVNSFQPLQNTKMGFFFLSLTSYNT